MLFHELSTPITGSIKKSLVRMLDRSGLRKVRIRSAHPYSTPSGSPLTHSLNSSFLSFYFHAHIIIRSLRLSALSSVTHKVPTLWPLPHHHHSFIIVKDRAEVVQSVLVTCESASLQIQMNQKRQFINFPFILFYNS